MLLNRRKDNSGEVLAFRLKKNRKKVKLLDDTVKPPGIRIKTVFKIYSCCNL